MKSVFICVLAASTQLRYLRHARNDAVHLRTSTDNSDAAIKQAKELSLVDAYMAGNMTRVQLFQAADKLKSGTGWDVAADKLKHDLPAEVMSLLRTGAKSKQPFEQAALDRARVTLNGMIETAQAEYDLKDMECMAFEESNRAEFDQTVGDLSRIGSNIANDNGVILASKMDIKNALDMVAEQEKLLKAAMDECEKTRFINDAQLATLKSDLEVAEFIVKMTECKEGAALLQSTVEISSCPMADGTSRLSFKEGFLAQKVGTMQSEAGKQALMAALLASHPSLDTETKQQYSTVIKAKKKFAAIALKARVGKKQPKEAAANATPPSLSDIMNPTEAPVLAPPKAAPTLEEAKNKCVLGKPDCGLLTDNMALMWGEVKDAVDELTAVMAANEAQCKATSDSHNGEISMWQGINSQKNVELSEATGALNSHTEEQTESQASKDELTKEYDDVMGECQAVLHEILFTKICGTQTVRGEIAKFSETYGPTDIHDCVVTDWIPQECTIECIDQVLCDGAEEGKLPHPSCAGGTQNMTRNVVQNESLGAACPALILTKGCNNQPCPIHCEQSEWSPFGKCSKECGGGMQQRSRNIVVKPDNGGESCGPSSDAQTCNVQSCDIDCVLAEWSVWGPCSRACNSGVQERFKEEISPAEGNGKCLHHKDAERFEQQTCNTLECPPEPICVAMQDVVLAVDVSGSLKQSGFDTMMTFVKDLVSLYTLGVNETQMGVLEYSKEGKIVAPLQSSMDDLVPMLEKITFQRGVTDMAQGFSLAKTILMEGRKDASSVVILLTDGKPSFKFATTNAATELREMGVRLVIVPIFMYGDPDFMEELASDPPEDNVMKIGGLEVLANDTMGEAKKIMTGTCAMLYQPEEPPMEEGPPTKGLLTSIFGHKQKQVPIRKIFHRPKHDRIGRHRRDD
jgi:hypothetical protein